MDFQGTTFCLLSVKQIEMVSVTLHISTTKKKNGNTELEFLLYTNSAAQLIWRSDQEDDLHSRKECTVKHEDEPLRYRQPDWLSSNGEMKASGSEQKQNWKEDSGGLT